MFVCVGWCFSACVCCPLGCCFGYVVVGELVVSYVVVGCFDGHDVGVFVAVGGVVLDVFVWVFVCAVVFG